MASPTNLNIPRKRGSISSQSGIAKKRKPSNLRNAFSPDAESAGGSPRQYSRSPSVESNITTSVINGVGGKKRRKKGGDGGSVAGSSIEGGMSVEARRKQEKEYERMLEDFMTPAQMDRYATYRRIRLKRETVRKLVNQTLSQSVPQPIIIAVTSYSKTFIGELIDRALTVRDEWSAVRTHLPNPNLPPQILSQSLGRPSAHIKDERNKPTNSDITGAGWYPNQVDRSEGIWKEVEKDASLQERLKACDKGPLTPAHLREALRRYKRDRDGGGAGFAGMSLEGVERTMGRTGGKRLFK
ncbi:TAF40 Transcription initiation factor TFIID subunit TAF11 [Pyrenophora tritici-repentis]|nr:transcription initiation factor tfiid protein [Pyrenophora tritici-repentis]KAI0575529.1 transcription initiation factor tfiid subunit beta [Pyrenophora tritici-repentis]KAI0583055.1 transcription initiation factor tfiid subunit beta [Pyrenophora tritici-repentis]KAI0611807.1 transcription initiation factor tfiid subunit beta [Pyrenophora tritici-repentis]KAI0627596.1 transcription initiation factor tfiid subunit beta [Pyrenophora tritici-repentis]